MLKTLVKIPIVLWDDCGTIQGQIELQNQNLLHLSLSMP